MKLIHVLTGIILIVLSPLESFSQHFIRTEFTGVFVEPFNPEPLVYRPFYFKPDITIGYEKSVRSRLGAGIEISAGKGSEILTLPINEDFLENIKIDENYHHSEVSPFIRLYFKDSCEGFFTGIYMRHLRFKGNSDYHLATPIGDVPVSQAFKGSITAIGIQTGYKLIIHKHFFAEPLFGLGYGFINTTNDIAGIVTGGYNQDIVWRTEIALGIKF